MGHHHDTDQSREAPPLQEVDALILAGGLGTRLRTVVSEQPKVLAPILGRPFLFYLLDQLVATGLRHVILLVGYKAEMVREAVGTSYRGMSISYSQEDTPLGTGGAIRAALPLIKSPLMLLMNGDSYCNVRFGSLHAFHQEQNADVSLTLSWVEDASRFGSVAFDDRHRVHLFREKRPGAGQAWINAGIYLLNRSLLEDVPTGQPVSLEKELFPHWINLRRMLAYPTSAEFLDIGTPESYRSATSFFQRNPVEGHCDAESAVH